MTISENEKRLDAEADKAARDLREFRNKRHSYFWNVGHRDTNGQMTVTPNQALDREATRLHSIVREANKRAADAEYFAKYPA